MLNLQKDLIPFKRRLQWRASLRLFWLTVSAGLAISCALLLVGRVRPLLFQWQLLLVGMAISMALLLVGQLYAWLKPLTVRQLARLGDAHLNLEERLTTALELSEGKLETRDDLRQAQLEDTQAHLRRASISGLTPVFKRSQLIGRIGLVFGLFLALVLLTLWPNPQDAVIQEQVELENLIQTEIAELEEIQTQLLEEVDALGETQVEELSESLQALIERLETAQAEGSPEQALAALSETAQTLEEYNQARLEQEQALNSLADALSQSDFEAAQEAGEALQQGNFDEAAQALQEAAQTPPDSQSQANALADSLQQAAADLAAVDPQMAQSLQQAADALRSGNGQDIQEALEQAAQQLAEAGQQASGQDRLSETLENIQQARQQLAQQQDGAGQGQQGQGQQGQGQQGQGQGAGQLQGQTKGTGGSGREDPDGNVAEGLTAEEGVSGPMPTNNGSNQSRLEDYDSVYAPQHLGGEGGPVVVPDRQGSDGSGIDIGQTPPNLNRDAGDVTVPYQEVFGQYQDQAATALENEHIPLGMRDYIRQYFGALEPGQ
jgi:hypothetical protein